MIRRDYILRIIEEWGAMLRRTRKQIEAGDHPAAGEELDKAFVDLVGTGAEAVSRLSETELLARLTMEGPTHIVREKALILVTLLQQAGQVHPPPRRQAQGPQRCMKSLTTLFSLPF